jgi:metallo-beta-lactamase class B
MKRQIKLATAAIFVTAMCAALTAKAGDWYAPQEPFAIYGNTYYVGTGGISSVLIASPAGHILIDVGGPNSPDTIVEHIRKLGFKVEDIRYILSSHEHLDHAGGIAALQKLSGATVLASPEAVKVLQSGQPDKGDPQYPNLDLITPVAHTRAVRDGETIKLGPLAVTAHFTPGHTKGATTWTWQSTEGGRAADMVYADSLSAVAADGIRYSANPLYSQARADVERSMALVESLKCDVAISAHPEFSDLWERKSRQPELGNAAFIDTAGCGKYVAKARAQLERTLAEDSKKAMH